MSAQDLMLIHFVQVSIAEVEAGIGLDALPMKGQELMHLGAGGIRCTHA